jgi:hypothetical protein
MSRIAFLGAAFCIFSITASAQQTTSSTTSGPQTPQAASIMQQSIAALTAGAPVNDVTMTGTITISGIASGTGTITFVATSSGQGSMSIALPSGTRTEIRSDSSGSQTLNVTGPDGVPHAVHTQSILSPHPACFFPALILSSGLSSADYSSSYVGPGTWNNAPAQHVAVWLQSSNSLSLSATDLQNFSQHDIYLDPSTMLPIAMTFTVHPYNPANPDSDIPSTRGTSVNQTEQVTFSDYRQVQGRRVAFNIQTSIALQTGALVTDIQISSVSFNTGATVAAN